MRLRRHGPGQTPTATEESMGDGDQGGGADAGRAKCRLRPRARWLMVVATVAAEIAGLRMRGYKAGGNVVVRCRQGHLFTTIWVPGASVKSVRLGWWRFQRCPVGRHWSIVTPVKQAKLTEDEARAALETKDIRIP
jgi:hypothetical protein